MKKFTKSGVLFNQFSSEVTDSLVEFVKYISELDADYIVFMARKSYCLYRVLLNASLVPTEKIIVSDKIFDLELDFLKNKNIALIDDTLIIGSTLSKTKKELEDKYGAKVSIHVFCVDKENWNRNLINPDKIFLKMESQELLSFCISIIRAFYVSARPYITDFPILKKKKLNINDIDEIILDQKYYCFDYTNELQKENNIKYYTVIPLELNSHFNTNLNNLIEIFKLRLYIEQSEDTVYLSVVPIVTIKCLSKSNLDYLFSCLLLDIKRNIIQTDKIEEIFVKEEAKLRLIQYLMSCKLASLFIDDISKTTGKIIQLIFDKNETTAHFGVWNFELINTLEINAKKLFSPKSQYGEINNTPLPKAIVNMANVFFEELNDEIESDVDLFTKFTDIFVMFFRKLEVPFRRKIHGMDYEQFSNSVEIKPLKNRLEIGLPFELIVEKMLISGNEYKEMVVIIGIILDVCNDLGIAVPITYNNGDSIFRAYRHGEPVNIANNELSLAYHLVKGYLEASGKKYITAIILQKMIVLFLKYAIREKIIFPVKSEYNFESRNGITVNVNYLLKGAVATHEYTDNDGLKRTEWLTDHLSKKGILRKNKENLFTLGNDIEASYIETKSTTSSKVFGNLFGYLVYERKEDGDKPISDKDMTILATCDNMLNTLKGIHGEIKIINRWINDKTLTLESWENDEEIKYLWDEFVSGNVYEAIDSAKFKYEGFIGGKNLDTIKQAEKYLIDKGGVFGRTVADVWNGIWKQHINIDNVHLEKFQDSIKEYMRLVIDCHIYINMILFCIKYKKADGKRKKSNIVYFEKTIKEFIDPINEKSNIVLYSYEQLLQRLKKYEDKEDEFPYKKTCAYYLNKLSSLSNKMETSYKATEELITRYARIEKRYDYKYMIWYDIIDSTASRVPYDHINEHRRNVTSFKKVINEVLEQTVIIFKKNDVSMFCKDGWNSKDDEKNIYISGEMSLPAIKKILEDLLTISKKFSVNFRSLIIPTDFVSSYVYREIGSNLIRGQKFLEHLARVKTKITEKQKTDFNGGNFLAIIGKSMFDKVLFPQNISFEYKDGSIVIEIEQKEALIKTRYGFIEIM